MRTGSYSLVIASLESIRELRQPEIRPRLLYLVSVEEMRELKQALLCGVIPPDLETKLSRLESRTFMHQFIAQNCRLFALILNAAYAGAFTAISSGECDELLRVLAYVRKDEDAIPDYTTGGFSDDAQELRMVISHLDVVLKRFKAWRLCHQVPVLWRESTGR